MIKVKRMTKAQRKWYCVLCHNMFQTKQAWSTHRKWKHPYHYKKWLEETTNVELNYTRIIERWYDKNNNIYYTLIEHKLIN